MHGAEAAVSPQLIKKVLQGGLFWRLPAELDPVHISVHPSLNGQAIAPNSTGSWVLAPISLTVLQVQSLYLEAIKVLYNRLQIVVVKEDFTQSFLPAPWDL